MSFSTKILEPHLIAPAGNNKRLLAVLSGDSFGSSYAVSIEETFEQIRSLRTLIQETLVPEEATEEHLQILGDIASHIKNPHYRQQLRQASNNEQMYQTAIQ